jgi:surface protein
MKKMQKLGLFTTWVLISVVLFNSNMEFTSIQDQAGIPDVPLMEWGGKANTAADPDAFISIWNTTLTSEGSSASNQVALPLEYNGTYDFTVAWGDGTNNTITIWNQAEFTHTYNSPGTYTITISGTIIGWRFDYWGDRLKLLEIQQWGALQLGNSGGYFYYCDNLRITATEALDLTGTTTLSSAFHGCRNLTGSGNLNGWNVSGVTDMTGTFAWAVNFNQPLDAWDVSSVTNMGEIFAHSWNFNQPLSAWNVSNVTNMDGMFYEANEFDQFIGGWNVSSVTNMGEMFAHASSFNQPLDYWDVSNVRYMGSMFQDADTFNQPLEGWDVSNVRDMDGLFLHTSSFNRSLASWDVSSVTSMRYMFKETTSFNQSLAAWDVSSVTWMEMMFFGASSFNQPLGTWNVSSVIDMREMFSGASSFNQSLASWDVSSVINMREMFSDASSFNQPLGTWNISCVTRMEKMFSGVTLSTSNYDGMLVSWSQLPLQSGVIFDAGNSQYGPLASQARQKIIDDFGWTISDGGAESPETIIGFPPAWFGVIMLGCLIGLVASLRTRRR